MSKYRSRKTEIDGIVFDSAKEARRYTELRLMQHVGQISGLELQKEFELIPAQYTGKRCIERAVKYRADFVYIENGETVVEDVKGVRTKEYIIKRKLMMQKYGIRIKEV